MHVTTKTVLVSAALVLAIGALREALGHDIYGGWRQPNNPNVSCCNNADCRATRAYVDEQGQWHAWNGMRWLLVPADKVLPTDFAGDGRSHLCEQADHVYCFTPGPPRS